MRGSGPVVALAGRRIDAAGVSHQRFPFDNVSLVARKLRQLFAELNATALVCSAANGADLLALEIAEERGMQYRIVLPFSIAEFRQESVSDRPGEWERLFDEVTSSAQSRGDVIVLGEHNSPGHHVASGAAATSNRAATSGHATALYLAANALIIEEALQLVATSPREAGGQSSITQIPDGIVGVAVWDGHSRGANDTTAAFIERLAERQIPVRHVLTLEG